MGFKIHYIFLLSMLLSGSIMAQRTRFTVVPNNNEEADSLRNLLNNTNEPLKKLELYKALYFNHGNNSLDSSAFYLNKGISLAKEIGELRWQVDLIRFKSLAYGKFLHYNYAADLNEEGVKLAKKIGYEEGEAWYYDRSGLINADQIYIKYLESSHSSLKDRLQKSVFYYKKAAQIFTKHKNNEGIGYVNSHLSWSYIYLEYYDSALSAAFRGLNARLSLTNKRLLCISNNDIGMAYNGLKNYPEAIKWHKSSIKIAKEINYYLFEAEVQNRIAEVYFRQGNYDSAFYYSDQALKLSYEKKFEWEAAKSAKILANLHEINNQFEQAIYYHELYRSKKDSLESAEKMMDVQKNEIQYAYNKEKLKSDQLQIIINLTMIGIAFIAVAITIIIYFSRRKLNKANKLLSEIGIITETQKNSIEEQAMKLEEMNVMKNKLFSIVSHDLRNPLTLTSTYLNLLKNENISEKDFKVILPEISQHINNTSGLLNNLLIWAKGQMSGNMLTKSGFDLSGLLNDNVKLISAYAKTKGVQVTLFIFPQTMVYADKALVDITCRNLLTNAVKFCRQGDSIRISTSREGDCIKVMISDTGIGIPEHKMNSIFSGNQASEAGTANETGWGLGLLLCKEFVEKNGGEISFESKPDSGTTFFFTLPVNKESFKK